MSFVKLSSFVIFMLFFNADIDAKKARKIVNGERVRMRYHAFRVSLQMNRQHFCSGTIMSPRHILTTSSCVLHDEGVFYGNIRILSGALDVQNDEGLGMYHQVCYIIHHEKYNTYRNWINDIAILVLTQEIPFSIRRGNAPPLMDRRTSTRTGPLTVGGWESNLRYQAQSNRFLRRIKVTIKAREVCFQYYPNLDVNQECVESISRDSFISEGDGGSALISRGKFSGIVSVIPDDPKLPFIFLDVNPYSEWMDRLMKKY